jgi:hypothetical protein
MHILADDRDVVEKLGFLQVFILIQTFFLHRSG